MKKYLLLCLLLFANIANSQISIVLQEPPPFQFKINNLWKVSIYNAGSSAVVFLSGKVTDMNTGKIIVEGTSSKFTCSSGTKSVNAAEISPIDIKKYDSDVENTLNRIGTFRSGKYQICVSVKSFSTGALLAEDCLTTEVINVTQVEIISPEDNEKLNSQYPVFTWLASSGISQSKRLAYEFNLYQVLDRQTPYYATTSNPAIFTQKKIVSTTFQYPLAAAPLMQGKTYCWTIKTYADGVFLTESEVRSFTYSDLSSITFSSNQSNYKNSDRGMLKDFFDNKKLALSSDESYQKRKNIIHGLSSQGVSNNFFNKGIFEKGIFRKSIFNDKPFEFRGNYSVNFNLQDKQSLGSSSPKNYIGIKFNPQIILYGLPFSADLYYDSRQNDFKQNINSFGFLFDPNSLKDIITKKVEDKKNEILQKKDEVLNTLKNAPENEAAKIRTEFEQKLKNVESEIPFYMKFFTWFNTLGLGVTYPNYSDYSVSGVKVTGLDLDMNPGLLHLHLSGLKNLDKIPDSVFSRKLYSGSLGVGDEQKTHFHLIYMKSYDDENSIDLSKVPNGTSPGENTILGTTGKLKLFKDKFTLQTEGGITFLTRDRLAPQLAEGDIPGILKDFANANTSSQFDYMYKVQSTINLPEYNNKIEGEYRLVGPGYISYGAPGLTGKGKTGFKISLEQSFLQEKIKFTGSVDIGKDNVGSFNILTTSINKMNFKLKLAFENAPSLTLQYIPNNMENNGSGSDYYKSNTNVFVLLSNLKIKETSFINNAALSLVSTNSSDNKSDSSKYTLDEFTLHDDVFFKKIPLSLGLSFGISAKNSQLDKTSILNLSFNSGYTFFEIWNNNLGINYSNELSVNNKLSLVFSSGISLGVIGDLNAVLDYSMYKEKIFRYGNSNIITFSGTLQKSF